MLFIVLFLSTPQESVDLNTDEGGQLHTFHMFTVIVCILFTW